MAVFRLSNGISCVWWIVVRVECFYAIVGVFLWVLWNLGSRFPLKKQEKCDFSRMYACAHVYMLYLNRVILVEM